VAGSNLAEILQRHDRHDLPDLADELGLEVDALLPLVDVLKGREGPEANTPNGRPQGSLTERLRLLSLRRSASLSNHINPGANRQEPIKAPRPHSAAGTK
jgi:hypothetical protein